MRLQYAGELFSYEQEGNGQVPAFFLHGWGGSLSSFRIFVRYLNKNYTAYLLDIPGFGQAPLPQEPLHAAQLADFAASFLRTLHIPPVVLVGHGLNAKIMVNVAARFPDLVQHLVLVDAVGERENDHLRHVTGIVTSESAVWRLPGFFEYRQAAKRTLSNAMGTHDYAMVRLMEESFATLLKESPRKSASLIQTPTVVVCGSKDEPRHVTDARDYEHVIRGAQLRLLSGVGHLNAQYNPDAFGRALLSVLG